ncbi:hypothetical protein BGZ60DRAFT_139725 [Tricladium varicosporioides]|nr:hypothetical protein BGZ60DRAFT_139725 [Hymenoscyphus varicosporioides]
MAAPASVEWKAGNGARHNLQHYADNTLPLIEDNSGDEQQQEEYLKTFSPDDEISGANRVYAEGKNTRQRHIQAATGRTVGYGEHSREETEHKKSLSHPSPVANGIPPYSRPLGTSVGVASPGGQENGVDAGHDISHMWPLLGFLIKKEPTYGVRLCPAREEDSSRDGYPPAQEKLTQEVGPSPILITSSLSCISSLGPILSSRKVKDYANISMNANSGIKRMHGEEMLEVEVPFYSFRSSFRNGTLPREEECTEGEYCPPNGGAESSYGLSLSLAIHRPSPAQKASSRMEVDLADNGMESNSGSARVRSKHAIGASKQVQSMSNVKQSELLKGRATARDTHILAELVSEIEKCGKPSAELASELSDEHSLISTQKGEITNGCFGEIGINDWLRETATPQQKPAKAFAEVNQNLRLSNDETGIGMRGGGNIRSKPSGVKSEKRSRTNKNNTKKYRRLSGSDEELAQNQSSIPEYQPDSAQEIYFSQDKDLLRVYEHPTGQIEVDPETLKDVKFPEQLRNVDQLRPRRYFSTLPPLSDRPTPKPNLRPGLRRKLWLEKGKHLLMAKEARKPQPILAHESSDTLKGEDQSSSGESTEGNPFTNDPFSTEEERAEEQSSTRESYDSDSFADQEREEQRMQAHSFI